MHKNENGWRGTLLALDSTIKDAISNLNETSLKIVMVINSDGILEGTISDGDIRRGLLRGETLNSSIASVINKSSLVAPVNMDLKVIKHLMFTNKIQQVPIVDQEQRVVGLHLWDEVLTIHGRQNIMVIMAGGKGSRLLDYTKNMPKPIVPILGKPMLERIIEKAVAEGFKRFILAINHLGHMVEDYFGDGKKWGVRIEYLREESPLGTIGALSLIDETISQPILVTNTDVLCDIQYGELLNFHVKNLAVATMAVRLSEWQNPYGVVKLDGHKIKGFEEKPIIRSYINAGVYVLDPIALDFLERSKRCDMPDLFERIRNKNLLTIAYPMHEDWLDVGSPEDLLRANS